jgi:benzoylformate decarboxylase
MTAAEAFEAAALARQNSDLLVQESASNVGDLLTAWPIVEQATYFTSASGLLGWGLPAAVGIAMAETNRTTVLALGDGSMQYSVHVIYTAVQHKTKLIILVPQNHEYAILKEFAIFEKTPNCRK